VGVKVLFTIALVIAVLALRFVTLAVLKCLLGGGRAYLHVVPESPAYCAAREMGANVSSR